MPDIVVGGVSVKKHAYIVKIRNKKYDTAYGCIFTSLGKKRLEKKFMYLRMKSMEKRFSNVLIFA